MRDQLGFDTECTQTEEGMQGVICFCEKANHISVSTTQHLTFLSPYIQQQQQKCSAAADVITPHQKAVRETA